VRIGRDRSWRSRAAAPNARCSSSRWGSPLVALVGHQRTELAGLVERFADGRVVVGVAGRPARLGRRGAQLDAAPVGQIDGEALLADVDADAVALGQL
jgi:hypothetical protein